MAAKRKFETPSIKQGEYLVFQSDSNFEAHQPLLAFDIVTVKSEPNWKDELSGDKINANNIPIYQEVIVKTEPNWSEDLCADKKPNILTTQQEVMENRRQNASASSSNKPLNGPLGSLMKKIENSSVFINQKNSNLPKRIKLENEKILIFRNNRNSMKVKVEPVDDHLITSNIKEEEDEEQELIYDNSSSFKQYDKSTNNENKSYTRSTTTFSGKNPSNAHIDKHIVGDLTDSFELRNELITKVFICDTCFKRFTAVFKSFGDKLSFTCDSCREKLTKNPKHILEKECPHCGGIFYLKNMYMTRHILACGREKL